LTTKPSGSLNGVRLVSGVGMLVIGCPFNL